MKRIAIGSDHRGFEQKNMLMQQLSAIDWTDVGCFSAERSDYPEFAQKVVELVRSGAVQAGLLLCGSGAGMVMAANRFAGIYAAVVWNADVAGAVKEDDHVNVLVLPSDYISDEMAVACVERWMQAEFKGGRYQERLAVVDTFGR